MKVWNVSTDINKYACKEEGRGRKEIAGVGDR